eukprot:gb/GECG01013230.1/.p1 GENE.gb/GECG01013230.1/~~gb/GECG01013230.1/.p1  ORF type:complete len:108 (+),score=3.98 gb/GECG01013230.1/:1-324(+)
MANGTYDQTWQQAMSELNDQIHVEDHTLDLPADHPGVPVSAVHRSLTPLWDSEEERIRSVASTGEVLTWTCVLCTGSASDAPASIRPLCQRLREIHSDLAEAEFMLR